jgi:hypothetical protein
LTARPGGRAARFCGAKIPVLALIYKPIGEWTIAPPAVIIGHHKKNEIHREEPYAA